MKRIDEIDKQIIEILQEDSRFTNSDLGGKLGISEATVRRRIERLLDQDIIRLVAVANPFKIGYELVVIIGLRVEKPRMADIEKQLTDLPDVRFLGVTLGSYDFMLEAWFRSTEKLLIFLTETLVEIPGILSTDSFQIIKLAKYTYDWGKPTAV